MGDDILKTTRHFPFRPGRGRLGTSDLLRDRGSRDSWLRPLRPASWTGGPAGNGFPDSARRKHEIRNTKSETNPNIEIRNPKQRWPAFVAVLNLLLGASDLFRISCFGFRICVPMSGSVFSQRGDRPLGTDLGVPAEPDGAGRRGRGGGPVPAHPPGETGPSRRRRRRPQVSRASARLHSTRGMGVGRRLTRAPALAPAARTPARTPRASEWFSPAQGPGQALARRGPPGGIHALALRAGKTRKRVDGFLRPRDRGRR